ncbi:MAG: MFS transporter [Spirochaetia bacterium]|nr:MFS transporter [Spirochaetia bacterium]
MQTVQTSLPPADLRRMAVIMPASFLAAIAIGFLQLGLLFVVKEVYLVPPAAVGWFGALWSAAYLAGVFLLMKPAKRLPARVAVALAVSVNAAALGLFLIAPSLPLAFLAYAVVGFSTALHWPPLMGWLSRGLEGEKLGKAAGLFSVSWTSGGIVSPWIAGLVSEQGKFLPVAAAALFFALEAVFILSSRAWLRDPWEARPDAKAAPAPDRSTALRFPAWIGVALVYAALGVAFTIFPVYARDELGLTEGAVGFTLTLRAVLTGSGFALLGRWHGWHFKRALVAAPIALMLPVIAALAFANLPWHFALGFALVGLLMAWAYNNSIFYGASGAPDRDRRMNVHEALLTTGQFAGAAAGGLVYQAASMKAVFLALALLLATGLAAQVALVAGGRK